MSLGYHSSEEYEFYKILTFYFPKLSNKIILGKKFETLNSYIIFDLCINDNILIEYDSKGTYHNDDYNINKDKLKEKFAINNGYKFFKIN